MGALTIPEIALSFALAATFTRPGAGGAGSGGAGLCTAGLETSFLTTISSGLFAPGAGFAIVPDVGAALVLLLVRAGVSLLESVMSGPCSIGLLFTSELADSGCRAVEAALGLEFGATGTEKETGG